MKNHKKSGKFYPGCKLLYLLILMLFSCFSIYAQDLTKSTYKEQEKTSSHSLLTGLGFGNNMVYMGATISQDKPFYTGTITYGYKNKLYASVSTFDLSAFDPLVAFNVFSLSYNHDINSWLDISIGASKYQVNSELKDTLFNNFLYGNFAIGADWNILYTNLTVGGIFSESSNAYLQLRNSRYFQTPELFNGKAFFSFDPYVNLLFGALTDDGTTRGISPPYTSAKSSGGHNSSGTSSNVFSLIEVDLGIPVGFNIGKFLLEAEPGYAFPLYSEKDIRNPKGFTLLLNCYFMIF